MVKFNTFSLTHRHTGHIVFRKYLKKRKKKTMCPMCLCVKKNRVKTLKPIQRF